MIKLPEFLKQGEPARLFPILADTSKEGRATSILLSCMSKVDEFAVAQIVIMGSANCRYNLEYLNTSKY